MLNLSEHMLISITCTYHNNFFEKLGDHWSGRFMLSMLILPMNIV